MASEAKINWFLKLLKGIFDIINEHLLKAEYTSDAGKVNIVVVILGFVAIFFVGLHATYWFIGSVSCVLFCSFSRTAHIDEQRKKRPKTPQPAQVAG